VQDSKIKLSPRTSVLNVRYQGNVGYRNRMSDSDSGDISGPSNKF